MAAQRRDKIGYARMRSLESIKISAVRIFYHKFTTARNRKYIYILRIIVLCKLKRHRRYKMGNMSFIKGMGAGLIVGACVGMTIMPDKKRGKKAVGKAFKAVETILSDVTEVMGL